VADSSCQSGKGNFKNLTALWTAVGCSAGATTLLDLPHAHQELYALCHSAQLSPGVRCRCRVWACVFWGILTQGWPLQRPQPFPFRACPSGLEFSEFSEVGGGWEMAGVASKLPT
jgi:hypothetical protein